MLEMRGRRLFLFLNALNILVHLDHGIIPAATLAISDSFGIDEGQLGLLGSLVFLGIVVNGLLAGWLLKRYPTQPLMAGALALSALGLLAFAGTRRYWVALGARLMTGGCQVFHIVFLPVWIDRYGGDSRTLWLTAVQVCIPLGIFLGYGVTSILVGHHLVTA